MEITTYHWIGLCWIISILISAGPFFTMVIDNAHKNKPVTFPEWLGLILMLIGFNAFVILFMLDTPFERKYWGLFYNKERVLNFIYFLPVISLGLLWLI